MKKATGGTGMLYWYSLPGVLAESDLTGTIKSEYVFFNGTRVARRDEVTPAGVYYYFSDHIKSASLVTDAAGNVKSESDYYPWGSELAMSNSDPNHYKFTGKERDSESGLDYFGARFYSAAMGRFMNPDWSERPVTVPYAVLSDPQTLNLYSYVRNSPVARFDADGHFVTSAGSATAPACNDGTDSCHQNTQTNVYATDDAVYVTTIKTTTTTYTDSEGNKVQRVTGTETVSVYSREAGHEGEYQGSYQRSLGILERTGLKAGEQAFGNTDGWHEWHSVQGMGEFHKANLSASDSLRMIGPSGMNQMIAASTPSRLGGAFRSALQHPWETLERGASGVGLGVCLAIPGCAGGLAGAAAAGFGLIEGGAGVMNGLTGR